MKTSTDGRFMGPCSIAKKWAPWTKEGADKKLSCGDFLLDEMKMTGGPLVATLGGISIPTNSAIKSTNRTKTWKKVSIKQIAQEIAKRYSLNLSGFYKNQPDQRRGRFHRTG